MELTTRAQIATKNGWSASPGVALIDSGTINGLEQGEVGRRPVWLWALLMADTILNLAADLHKWSQYDMWHLSVWA